MKKSLDRTWSAANRFIFRKCIRPATLQAVLVCMSLAVAGSDTWRRAESDDQYPALYSDDFIDSVLAEKNAALARGWRLMKPPPFNKGEKLVYDIGWGPLHAGFAILSAQPDTANATIAIVGKGATNPFFSSLYKVRDCYRTIIDAQGMYPLFFDQHIREGKFSNETWDLYDQESHRVYTHRKKPPFYANKPFGQSLLSCVYYLRTLNFTVGDTFTIDCFVDTMCHAVAMKCMERKTIRVEAGEFDCVLVKPYLVGKGRIFSKKDDIRVWFTDDAYKMPVLIESKITWGTLYARLMWYSRKEQ
ncbi:MAG TPA: DUF3108 domain-containing protein [Chitinivibrionales bacterium]